MIRLSESSWPHVTFPTWFVRFPHNSWVSSTYTTSKNIIEIFLFCSVWALENIVELELFFFLLISICTKKVQKIMLRQRN
jgi:hypothetical protein